jgi:integrase/recombinase XerD
MAVGEAQNQQNSPTNQANPTVIGVQYADGQLLRSINGQLPATGNLASSQPQFIAVSAFSVSKAIEAYLVYKADGGASEGYLSVRARKLRFFAKQYPSLLVSSEDIRVYLRQFKTSDVPTRQDQWKALSDLFKFATNTYCISNPMLQVDKPRFKKKSGQRLSRDQAKRLLSVVETDLEWAIITCYFGLRFRRIEAERLPVGDIKSDYIVVKGKERTEELPLLSEFRDKLLKVQNSKRPNEPLFGIKGDTLAYHINQLFRRAGIEGVRGSPHTLRNTAGALWSTFGGDWTSNRQLLRHSAKTMTDHYSPLTIDELRVKDEHYNPMLCLMRELGLVTDTTSVNTTGGQEGSTPSSTPSWLIS